MGKVGASEAKQRLSDLLDRVEAGEKILITRHGKAVARLIPAKVEIDHEKARRAMEGIIGTRREQPALLSIKGLSLSREIMRDRKKSA